MEFAARVRQARKALHLTLGQLAERSGVSRAALSKIERGERNPSLQNAVRIAEALGTDLARLLGGSESNSARILRQGEIATLVDPSSRAVREALFQPAAGLEVIRYTLPARASIDPFPAHVPGTREVFVVIAGRLRVEAPPHVAELAAGDAAELPGDVEHRLRNPGSAEARFLLVIVRPR